MKLRWCVFNKVFLVNHWHDILNCSCKSVCFSKSYRCIGPNHDFCFPLNNSHTTDLNINKRWLVAKKLKLPTCPQQWLVPRPHGAGSWHCERGQRRSWEDCNCWASCSRRLCLLYTRSRPKIKTKIIQIKQANQLNRICLHMGGTHTEHEWGEADKESMEYNWRWRQSAKRDLERAEVNSQEWERIAEDRMIDGVGLSGGQNRLRLDVAPLHKGPRGKKMCLF